MRYNKFGMHLQGTWGTKKKGSNEDFDPMMEQAIATGVSCFTVLHHDRSLVPWIKARVPNAQILMRDYHPDLMSLDPVQRAEETASWMEPLIRDGLTDQVSDGNEFNLAIEHGGDESEQALHYWRSKEGYLRIGEWTYRNTYKLKELLPEAKIFWPALAQGHFEDGPDGIWDREGDGRVWLEGEYGLMYCKDAIKLCHGIGVHPYWNHPSFLYAPTDPEAPDMRFWEPYRWARAKGYKHAGDPGGTHAIFPDKWLWLKEHSSHPSTGNVIDFFNSLYQYKYVLGGMAWLWRTPDPGHEAGRIQDRPLEGILTNAAKTLIEIPDLSKVYVDETPEPGPEEPEEPEEEEENTMPEFRLGFKSYADAHPDEVGEPLSKEYYEFRESGIPNEPVKITLQDTTTGTLKYFGDSNRVKFVPDPKA